jgi:hypothetical protein
MHRTRFAGQLSGTTSRHGEVLSNDHPSIAKSRDNSTIETSKYPLLMCRSSVTPRQRAAYRGFLALYRER